MTQVKSEASVLSRLKAWRELFGEPFGNGRNNPDNDIWFLLLDAEECIEGLQRYARSVQKTVEGVQSKCAGCITPAEHAEALAEVTAALRLLADNVETAWPGLKNLGPLVQARAALAKALQP